MTCGPVQAYCAYFSEESTMIYNFSNPGFVEATTGGTIAPAVRPGVQPIYPNSMAVNVAIQGYVYPFITLITLVNNAIVCYILTRKIGFNGMNIFLVGLAVADTMTGLSSSPYFVYVYTFGNYDQQLPYAMCWMRMYLSEVLPTMFHTASIWITLILGVMRYMCVCRPFQSSENLFSRKKCIAAVVFVYILSVAVHLFRALDRDIVPIELHPNHNDSSALGCTMPVKQMVERNQDAFYGSYFWCRVVFIHFIPCTVLIVCNYKLTVAMRHARLWHRASLSRSARIVNDRNRTTWMLIIIVGIFLLVETPLGIYFLLMIVHNTWDIPIIQHGSDGYVSLFMNLAILLTYPTNLVVYCVISRQFRNSIRRMFGCRPESGSNASSFRSVKLTEVNDDESPRKSLTGAGDRNGYNLMRKVKKTDGETKV